MQTELPKGQLESGLSDDHFSCLKLRGASLYRVAEVGWVAYSHTGILYIRTSVFFYKGVQLNSLMKRHINEDRNVNDIHPRAFLTCYFVKTSKFPADFHSVVRNKCVSCSKEDSGEVAIITGFR